MTADSRHSLVFVAAQLLPRTEVIVQFRYRPRRSERKLNTSFYIVPANVYLTVTVNKFIFGCQYSSEEPVSEFAYATKGADNFEQEYQQLTRAISQRYPWAEQFLAECWATAQRNPDYFFIKSLERC